MSASSAFFYFSQNALIGKPFGFAQIPPLKVSTILPQVIFALGTLVFSVYKPFEKVFRGALSALIGMIILFTLMLCFQKYLTLNQAPETLGVFKPLLIYWPQSLMYLGLSLLNFNLFSLFIFGFINRLFVLSEGIKYFIPLSFILSAAGAVASNSVSLLIKAYKWPLTVMILVGIVLLILSLFIFNWSWKRLPDSLNHLQDESHVPQKRFPFLSAAYLLAGSLMVKSFLDILFNFQIKLQLPNPLIPFLLVLLVFASYKTSLTTRVDPNSNA